MPSFSLRSSLACLLCAGALHSAEARPSEETAAWIQAVTAACGGSWSPRDIAAVDTLFRAVHSDPILEAAQRARILLVAPFRGPNAASRRACLYHPQGAAVTMLGTLADAAYAQDGLHGDGRSYADTLFDGAGLSSDDLSILLHGRSFETLNSDATCYLLSGTGTRINGETGIMPLVPADKQRVFVTKKMAGVDTLTEEEAFDDASKIHYSARSQRLLGRAYAEAVISLRAKP